MKQTGLEVRLRLCAKQATYMTEFCLNSKAKSDIDHSPNTGTRVIAPPHQPFEVCVELEASYVPYSAEVLTVEIEARSVLKRESEEMEAQTWSIPLRRRETASKNNRGLDVKFAREHCFSTYTFWTRDKSPLKFSSGSHPLLTPQVGEWIKVRVQRGRLPRSEIEPRLPMREHDTNPASAPTELELEDPTVIDKCWFKRISGRNGDPIEFAFEVCDEDYATRTLESKVVERQRAYSTTVADDCDDESHVAAIKTEEQSLTTGEAILTTTTVETVEHDRVSPPPVPLLLHEANQEAKTAVESALPTDTRRCILRPREEGTKVNYASHPIDQYIDAAIEASTTEDQAEMSPDPKKIGYAQFYPLDDNGRPIKPRGRPKGWKKSENSREANGLEPYPKKSKRRLDGGGKDLSSATDIKGDLGPSKIRGDSDALRENRSLREPPRGKTDLRAKKKAQLTLELEELKVEQCRLRVERESMDLEEEDLEERAD